MGASVLRAPHHLPNTTLILLFLAAALAASAQQTPACSPGNSTEAAALLAFKDGLTSATALADWTPGSKAWTGVGCDAEGQVVSLELYVRQLAGAVAWDALAQLSRLQTLHLGSNSLFGSVDLASLSPSLTRVVLSDNQFKYFLPEPWVLPTGLRTLDLSSNQLNSWLPDTVRWPSSLAELDLSRNSFSDAIPGSWVVPASLTLLSLYNNYLTGTLPTWVGRESLRVLVEPQAGPKSEPFCGEVPASPQYLNVSELSWAPLTVLPECQAAEAPVVNASPAAPTPAIVPAPPSRIPAPATAIPAPPSRIPAPSSEPTPASLCDYGYDYGCPSGSPAPNEEPDKQTIVTAALLIFRYGISVEPGQQAPWDSWRQNDNPCDWWHITCEFEDGEEQVTQIYLPGWGLQGSIAWDQLSKLPSLHILNLEQNSLSGPLGPILPANLTQLDVSDNNLSGTLPPSLPARLHDLKASSNWLSGSIPQTWSNSTALQLVKIDNNTLTGTLPSWPELQGLSMFVESQSGAGLCGQVPEQPRYSRVTELPSCDSNGPSSPPPPSPTPEASSSGISTGALVGAIVGGIVALVLLAALGWWVWKKRRQPNLLAGQAPASGEKVDPYDGVASTLEGNAKHPPDNPADVSHWQLGTMAVEPDKPKEDLKVPAALDSALSEMTMPQSPTSVQPPPSRRPHTYGSNDSAQLRESARERSSTPDSTVPASPTVAAGQGRGCGRDPDGALRMEMNNSRSCSGGVDVTPWLLRYQDFDLIEPIGKGSYACVHRANWGGTMVAVKVFKDSEREKENQRLTLSSSVLDNLRNESTLMASLRHPNIVNFLGVCSEPPCLVSEFCHRGSFDMVLSKAAAAPDPAAALSWHKRLQLLLDAAKGMHYLHSRDPPVIHRDFKSPNLLVTKDWSGKIADFNLSKVMHPDVMKNSQMILNPCWLAPEMLRAVPSSTASDVFAFGVVMFEALTLSLPWSHGIYAEYPWLIVNAVTEGERPPIPEYSQLRGGAFAGIDAYVQLLQQCWAQDAAARPAFADILQCLQQLLRQLSVLSARSRPWPTGGDR